MGGVSGGGGGVSGGGIGGEGVSGGVASVAQSSAQAPFTSEFVGSILATDSCGKKH